MFSRTGSAKSWVWFSHVWTRIYSLHDELEALPKRAAVRGEAAGRRVGRCARSKYRSLDKFVEDVVFSYPRLHARPSSLSVELPQALQTSSPGRHMSSPSLLRHLWPLAQRQRHVERGGAARERRARGADVMTRKFPLENFSLPVTTVA